VLFLVALFLTQRTSIFKNTISFVKNKQEGLSYDAKIEDLVNKDTDGDGVLDWEEPLYGLDPTKKETTPGIPDITVINKLRINQGSDTETNQNIENLTETEKFSRELFSTVASLNQNGVMDQAMAEKISSSLSEQIKNSAPKKVFLYSDIKIINTNSAKAIQTYKDTLINIFEKNKMPSYTAMDVLQKFIVDENSVDASVLTALDPIIKSTKGIVEALAKMSVPQSLAFAHIDFLNGWEKIMENLSDIRLYDTDPVLSLGGISQYEDNSNFLFSAGENLMELIN